jgi:hypothetical protein
MSPFGRKLDLATRIFDVECKCGKEFRASFEVGAAGAGTDRGFLVQPSGQCPHCGLKLEEVEPPRGPVTPGGRSRA